MFSSRKVRQAPAATIVARLNSAAQPFKYRSRDQLFIESHNKAAAEIGGVTPSSMRDSPGRASLRLFAPMFRNSVRTVDLFNIPPENFVESAGRSTVIVTRPAPPRVSRGAGR